MSRSDKKGNVDLRSKDGEGFLHFRVEKTDCFQQFPPSFQHPLRKTCKRNVEKCFSSRKTAWKTRVKPWNIHFYGEKLLKSPARRSAVRSRIPPKKESFV